MSDFTNYKGWNFRVVERDEYSGDYAVHEVYYSEIDGETLPVAYTKRHVAPIGESYGKLKESMEKYNEAFNKPALKQSDIKNNGSSNVE